MLVWRFSLPDAWDPVRSGLAAGGGSLKRTRLFDPRFPASRENTGNFGCRGLRRRLSAQNPATLSVLYGVIPYASEQGIYFGLAGN
jgi:hypothetical protein